VFVVSVRDCVAGLVRDFEKLRVMAVSISRRVDEEVVAPQQSLRFRWVDDQWTHPALPQDWYISGQLDAAEPQLTVQHHPDHVAPLCQFPPVCSAAIAKEFVLSTVWP
jgi:hypothetical protein